MIEVKSN